METEQKEEGIPFFPGHFLKEVTVIFIMLGLILTLVALHPAVLGPKADPLNTPEHIKPEWYFLSIYQFLKFVPRTFGIVAQVIGVIILFVWPFLDKGPQRNPLKRPYFLAWTIFAAIAAVILGIWGHIS